MSWVDQFNEEQRGDSDLDELKRRYEREGPSEDAERFYEAERAEPRLRNPCRVCGEWPTVRDVIVLEQPGGPAYICGECAHKITSLSEGRE